MSPKNIHHYDDILYMEHHVSQKHPPMKLPDRAAQFGSFEALSGHSDAIDESARITDSKREHSEYIMEVLDSKLQIIRDNLSGNPLVTFTVFKPDEKKSGGAYVDISGNVRTIDTVGRLIHLTDGTAIDIDMIHDIKSRIFNFTYENILNLS